MGKEHFNQQFINASILSGESIKGRDLVGGNEAGKLVKVEITKGERVTIVEGVILVPNYLAGLNADCGEYAILRDIRSNRNVIVPADTPIKK